MKIITNELIGELKQFLTSYWYELQERYGCSDVMFKLVTPGEYATLISEYSYDHNIENTCRQMLEDDKINTFMKTLGYFNINEQKIVKIKQIVVMSLHVFYEIILINLDNLDDLKEYFKQSLLHEMGHVLSHIERYDDKSVDEWFELRKYDESCQEESMKALEDIKDPKEWYIKYNLTHYEEMANTRVGIDLRELVRLYMSTGKLCEIEVNQK